MPRTVFSPYQFCRLPATEWGNWVKRSPFLLFSEAVPGALTQQKQLWRVKQPQTGMQPSQNLTVLSYIDLFHTMCSIWFKFKRVSLNALFWIKIYKYSFRLRTNNEFIKFLIAQSYSKNVNFRSNCAYVIGLPAPD